MHPSVALVASALLLVTGPAWADDGEEAAEETSESDVSAPSGKNCLGDPVAKPVLSHTIGIKYGDWGLESQLRVGACIPLVKNKGLIFDLSFIEAGFVNYLTPIYDMPGGYLAIAPLSFLQFWVEAGGIFYWPIGVSAAGYYPMDSLESDYTKDSLLAEDGQTALGWYFRAGPTLQVAVPLGSKARLIVLDTLRFEHFRIGDAPVYFHNRNDIPATNPDWFIDNVAVVMVGLKVHPNAELRLGANDQLTMNLSGMQKSNAVRGVAMISMARLGKRVRDFTPILTMGIRTDHPVRQWHFNFIAALTFKADLGKL